jgi:transposase InsO family protein
MLGERLGVSERQACRITGQQRSTQRHRPRRSVARDDALRAELSALSRRHPRCCYRMAWVSLRSQGWEINRKKIQRLWREEGLRVPAKRRKRYRLGVSTAAVARLRAERPDHVWAFGGKRNNPTLIMRTSSGERHAEPRSGRAPSKRNRH